MKKVTNATLVKTLIFIFSAIMTLSACQPTPDKPIIVGKNQEVMLSAAAKTNTAQAGTVLEQANAPANYTNEISLANGRLMITVNASVSIPDAQGMPTLRVKAADFTQEQTDGMVKALFKGQPIYEVDESPMTKQQIQDRVVYWNKQRLSEFYVNDPEGQALIDEEIKRLEEKYPSAPEESRKAVTVSDGKLKLKEVDKEQSMGHAEHYMGLSVNNNITGDEPFSSLSVQNNSDLKQSYKFGDTGVRYLMRNARLIYNYIDNKDEALNYGQHAPLPVDENTIISDPKALEKLKTTPAEAKSLVAQLLKDAGADYMQICAMYLVDDENMGNIDGKVGPAEHYAYRIQCARTVDGIPCSYINGMSGTITSDPSYFGYWTYEKMESLVDDRGIISLEWSSPIEVTDTIIKNSSLLPFSDIMERFEQMMRETYEWRATQRGASGITISVTRISLELQRIAERDSIENGLLVPAWNFYGTKIIKDSGQENEEGFGEPMPVLTINAIDGSIIDPGRGY